MREILARAGAKHGRGRSNTPGSSLVSVDDDDIEGATSHQSDGEQATSAPQSPSRLPSKNLKREKESMGDIRNALLVVAALITSTTYQAVLQPPSFIPKVDNNCTKGFQGYHVSLKTGPHGRDLVYILFMSGNTFGFLVSVQMIICLTRDLPVRLPLLLSMTALVQTYYCFTYYLPFTLQDKTCGLKNVELLSMLPVTMSILLLLAQRQLARALNVCLERLSRFNLLGDMYSLRTQSSVVNQEKESIGDVRNTLLVVATLIASTTYQAVLQPPRFTIKVSDNSMEGFLAYYSSWVTHPLGRDMVYISFISGNTFGLLLSIQMIIRLTRNHPVRLPLLLSVTALVQTYYCFTYFLPFTLLNKASGLKNVELLSVIPVTMSILLLLAQRWLALALDVWLKQLSGFNFQGDMYSLRTQSFIVNQEKESIGDMRNSLLVVAALIASTTYQAVLQPPSFTTEVTDDSAKGFLAYYSSWVTHPLGRDIAYIGFISGNTFGLLLSIQMIICLTRNVPVRLPLLLSMTALVQTYYCFTYYLPFTLLKKVYGLKNVELLSVLPVMMSILLLLAQKWLALALDLWLKKLSGFNFQGDMYSLRTQVVNEREMRDILARARAKHGRAISNSSASSLDSVEDQSDCEPVTNSKNLNKEKESLGNKRSALLAVATLIASMTYQSVLQPPSFTTEVNENSREGFLAYYASWVTRPLGRDIAFIGFISGNTFGLLLSIQMIICLTRDLPVRLLLLLSVTALVQTYYCITYYLPFTLLDKAFGLKNVELLSVLLVTVSILLLLAQRQLALALDVWLEWLSGFNFLGDMYSLRTQSVIVNDRESRDILSQARAEHERGRSISPASRPLSEEDQSDGEPVTNAPQSLSRSPSNNLKKEKESMSDLRNALLVVATLVASATYQAVLQPPSFMIKVDSSSMKGFLTSYASWMTGPLGSHLAYIAFMNGNTFGFLVSVQTIICLTRDLPVRLPLLLSMTAMVQTYYCLTYYLPFTLPGKAFGLKNVDLLSVLLVTVSILLLLAQRQLALALDLSLKRLSRFDFVGDIYSLRTQSVIVNDRKSGEILSRAGAEHERGRSMSPASRLLSEEDQSDGEPVTNAPQSFCAV
ncbi:uncharacterized protein LOC104446390 [Eucalyptus grandis]|uniref:uncharacterized protein LOC104446390 n=1 Tax=Eucalyptus grandis TaxID=71139 RepID=UPI00192EE173|nr:uncharacterized protein LOC104446390 [Eucalyptus grandis]